MLSDKYNYYLILKYLERVLEAQLQNLDNLTVGESIDALEFELGMALCELSNLQQVTKCHRLED